MVHVDATHPHRQAHEQPDSVHAGVSLNPFHLMAEGVFLSFLFFFLAGYFIVFLGPRNVTHRSCDGTHR